MQQPGKHLRVHYNHRNPVCVSSVFHSLTLKGPYQEKSNGNVLLGILIFLGQ